MTIKSDDRLPVSAEAKELKKIFVPTDQSGFRIPIYQRHYDWTQEHVERLFETIFRGCREFLESNKTGNRESESSLVFLGTLVLIEESKNSREEGFRDNKSLSVVDGQQRLTTISLIIGELRHRIYKLHARVGKKINKVLNKEAAFTKKLLMASNILTTKNPDLIEGHEERFSFYVPKLVRQDGDTRGARHEGEYMSNIATYLYELSKNIHKGMFDEEILDKLKKDVSDYNAIVDNVKLIRSYISLIENGNFTLSESSEKVTIANIMDRNCINLFLSSSAKNSDTVNHLKGCNDPDVAMLVRLIFFSKFMLNRVILTVIEVNSRNESSAFDIFESLNSTGEPLTAIQTLKPKIVDSLGDSYKSSEEKFDIDYVDKYLEKYKDKKQSNSTELIISFYYYLVGISIPKSLREQRKAIRNLYDMMKNDSTLFTRELKHVAEYKDKFWLEPSDGHLRIDGPWHEHIHNISMFLQFIRDTNTKMTIPILARYWPEDSYDEVFFDAVKAMVAFIVIRRSMTSGTANIDSDFKNLLSNKDLNSLACLDKNRQRNSLMSINDFKSYFRNCLFEKSAQKPAIKGKSDWLEHSIKQPQYKNNKALCKFLLLCAASNTRISDDNALEIARSDSGHHEKLLTVDTWHSELYRTIEHIAPRKREDNSDWNIEIYKDDLEDSIGNLTILGKNANTSLGNRDWVLKKQIYKLYLAPTEEEFKEKQEYLNNIGINVAKRIEYNEVKANDNLLLTVSEEQTWDKEVILKRSENILGIVWDKVSGWLDL